MPQTRPSIYWNKLGLAVAGSVMLDLAASLVSQSSLKEAVIHAAVVTLSVAGSFFMEAYKRVEAAERPRRIPRSK